MRLRAQEAETLSDQVQARPADSDTVQTAEGISSEAKTPFSIEGTKFLRELVSKTERDAGEEPIKTAEVARFRLLASIIGNQGNDQRALGVHDANLLFAEGSDFTFGRRELSGLVFSGLENFQNENTPLWRWYAVLGGFRENLLPIYSLVGPADRRVGAFLAMQLMSAPLPAESRDGYIRSWFWGDKPIAVKVAALTYLGDLGVTADLPAVKRELDRGDYQTTLAATDAIIRISLRQSREKAISALYDLQPTYISRNLLNALFENSASLTNEVLMQGIGHANSEVRRFTVNLLRVRHALPDEAAERLMGDGDAMVRYEALKSLVDGGRTFSDPEAKAILVKPTQNPLLGGLGGFGATNSTGEACWEQYHKERLRALPDAELEKA